MCYVSNFFFLPIPPIIGPRQPSLSNSFPYFCFCFCFSSSLPCRYFLSNISSPFLALLVFHFAVTLYPMISLPFWPFFSSTLPLLFTQLFHSLFGLSSPHLLFYLILPLFFFQLFPSLFVSSSPHYSISYRYNFSTHFSPFYSSPPYLIFNKFAINSSTSLSSIQTMFCLQNNLCTLLLSFNEFFLATLLMSFCVLIALLWVDVFWYFGVVFLNSPITCSFSPSYDFV